MDFWDILVDASWAISVLLIIWMVADAVRVQKQYSEDFLMSSREGADELMEAGGKKQ